MNVLTAKEVQEVLFDLGFLKGIKSEEVDGIIGNKTRQAIRDFQSSTFVSGEIDDRTNQALNDKIKVLKEVQVIVIIDNPLQANEYFNQIFEKTQCFIHLTGGNRNAHFVKEGWERDQMNGWGAVATAYIISGDDSKNRSGFAIEDGQVLRTFDDKFWAYHTGSGALTDQRSVGIEICNWANLTQKNGKFFTYTGEEIPSNEVEELPFRGINFWHRISNKQLDSLAKLLSQILKKYPKIREGYEQQVKNLAFDGKWSDYKPNVLSGREMGIVTHTNVIPAERFLRWDCPPFPRLLERLKNL